MGGFYVYVIHINLLKQNYCDSGVMISQIGVLLQ